ncbi:alpha/beta hydrolase family protein [Fulvivirga ligni]|uniref:alpha/beta hydrolase family protein n=1 Tax=Fulvivirga ligni TaxID=2904246 RepID=UPI001F17926E|nr:alpha/beta family hydrolase [Fulvivirga ligni]UII19465.1 dienelactone hydrolase family protein [Fulvivirga ligni]
MQLLNTTIFISEEIGSVSAEWTHAQSPIAQIILGHGAGAGMHHPFMQALAQALKDNNITSLRYQFPYMEAGKNMPDRPKKATKTIMEVANAAHQAFPSLPLFMAGKSFGGRMSSLLAAEWSEDFIKGLIFYGFPLHPPGKPSKDRAAHLSNIKVPMLYLQGTRDKLATPELLDEVTKPLKLAEVKYFEGADHSFTYLKKYGVSKEASTDLLAEASAHWIKSRID